MGHGDSLLQICSSLLELPEETPFNSLVFILAAGGVYGENTPNAVFKSIKKIFWDIKGGLRSKGLVDVSTVVTRSVKKGFAVPVSSGVLLISSKTKGDLILRDEAIAAGQEWCMQLAAESIEAYPDSVFRLLSVVSTKHANELHTLGLGSITANHRFVWVDFLPENEQVKVMQEKNSDGTAPIHQTDLFLYD